MSNKWHPFLLVYNGTISVGKTRVCPEILVYLYNVYYSTKVVASRLLIIRQLNQLIFNSPTP